MVICLSRRRNNKTHNWLFSSSHSLWSFSRVYTRFYSINLMDTDNINNNNNNGKEIEAHYHHTDACKDSRWTSRESYEYMLNRPWQKIVLFYSNLVSAPSPIHSLSSILFPTQLRRISPVGMQSECDNGGNEDISDYVSESMRISNKKKGGRWDRVTFKIVLSYHGSSFDGWQKQPGLDSVQSSVERTLGTFVDEMKAKQLKDRGLPVEVTAVVAGRTDKGVSALQQVCSFYTWRKDVKPQDIIDAFSDGEQGKLRIVSASEVSRVFHPNFCAKWRRYLYIFPLNEEEDREQHNTSEEDIEKINHGKAYGSQIYKCAQIVNQETVEDCLNDDEDVLERKKKPIKFKVTKVNELLCQLEGKLLSYKMFARDTKASRSTGPPTECFMFHARAAETRLPSPVQDGEGTKVMCVELVANRFLRKMVRVLVATAIREAAAGAGEDALIKLMNATCRRATAPPAPPDGLCLVDVGYSEFDPRVCYI